MIEFKIMCVAYPGKIIEITDNIAKVDFDGNIMNVRIGFVKANVGDYVLVHAGLALEAMNEEKARVMLETWEQLRRV